MCPASYTTRLSSRPSRRGSAIDAFTDIVSNRSAGPIGCRVAAAHTWNPKNIVACHHDGPTGTFPALQPAVRQVTLHPTLVLARGRLETVAGTPGPYENTIRTLERRRPGRVLL